MLFQGDDDEPDDRRAQAAPRRIRRSRQYGRCHCGSSRGVIHGPEIGGAPQCKQQDRQTCSSASGKLGGGECRRGTRCLLHISAESEHRRGLGVGDTGGVVQRNLLWAPRLGRYGRLVMAHTLRGKLMLETSMRVVRLTMRASLRLQERGQ